VLCGSTGWVRKMYSLGAVAPLLVERDSFLISSFFSSLFICFLIVLPPSSDRAPRCSVVAGVLPIVSSYSWARVTSTSLVIGFLHFAAHAQSIRVCLSNYGHDVPGAVDTPRATVHDYEVFPITYVVALIADQVVILCYLIYAVHAEDSLMVVYLEYWFVLALLAVHHLLLVVYISSLPSGSSH